MPTVNWNRDFGETNISVELSRTARNSFDIDAGELVYIVMCSYSHNFHPERQ